MLELLTIFASEIALLTEAYLAGEITARQRLLAEKELSQELAAELEAITV